LQDHAVGTFYLVVGLWVCHGCPIHTDVEFVAELQEFPARELGPVVGDDGVRRSKTMDGVSEERHCLLCPEIRNGAHLYPLGKFVDCDQQVGEAPGAFRKGPTMSSPHTAKGHFMGMVCRM
jgi:hypothetical protein